VNIPRLILALFSAVAFAAPAWPAPRQEADSGAQAPTVTIAAKRFEFEPAEIHLKAGEPATLAVTSQDVTHGFFSRQLGFDEDLPPGKAVDVHVKPEKPGRYTVICDHYCGSGHGGMKLTVVVE
jgi:cytochrome c oxidase subunit 2